MEDKYRNYNELRNNEREAEDYRILVKQGASGLAIIAHHGGRIEPGTTDIAKDFAGNTHSFYSFAGLKPKGNRCLHINSVNFDEPEGLSVARNAGKVIAIHGCEGKEETIYLGGSDHEFKKRIREKLNHAGFHTGEHRKPELQGINPGNICNRGKTGKGVQLEISNGLRKKMFFAFNTQSKKKKTGLYKKLISTLRRCIAQY